MNRLLPFVYGQFHSRLLWPVMAYLLKWLTKPLDSSQRLLPIIYRLPLRKEPIAFRSQTTLAIGMLMAGWLGATQAHAQSPGGVSANLQLWLKADNGVVSSSSAVSQWTDQSTQSHNLVQGTAGNRPLLQGASSLFNFNPSIKFDGANDRLEYKLTRFMSTTSSGSFFGAASNAVNGGYENLGDLGIDNPHMGTLGNQQIMWMNSSAPVRIDHPTILTANKPTILGYFWNGGGPNVGSGLRQNGTEYNNATTEATAVGNGGPVSGQFTLGSYEGVENWNGHIAEVFLYDRNLTSNEKDRVDTYLAVKYGTTLTHNYLAANGGTIYTVSSYSANIAGIGRDDAQLLNQKQSKSINAEGLVTIGNGTGIAATNALNSNSFSADNSFEIIGDNGLAASYATAYLPSVYVSPVPSAFRLMSRIWRVQETGTVGIITVSVPASSRAEILLVSSSATFTPGSATEITLTPDGSGNLTAQVDLTDGQFFTFGATVIAPGGVTADMQIWVKADNGIVASGSAVNQWTDQSPENHNLVQATAGNQPLLQGASTFFNFNPSVKFDGANDRLAYKLTRFMSTTSSGTFFGAASNAVNGGYENLGDLGIDNPHMGTLANQQIMWMNSSAPVQINHPAILTANKPTILGYFWNGGGPDVGSGLRQNGTEYNIATTEATAVGNGGPADGQFTLGSYEGVENWNGHIAEAFLYSRNLTTQEKDRVDTYLSVKYGTTLTHNYLASNGATIYNVSSYSTNITGIGRDNASGLHQKQSKSINAKSVLTIGLGTALATTNAANTNSFAVNNSFEIVGDNGLPYSYSALYTPTSFTPAGGAGFYRMAATWKVQETGTVGTVVIGAAGSSGADYLLVSNSASFPSGSTQELILTPDGNGNLVASVDLTDGQFFTFGSAEKAPGGILAGLQLWLKGDAISDVTDGGNLANWNNSVLSVPYSVSQPVGSTTIQPLFYNSTATNLVNYNPALYFDGGDELKNLSRLYLSTDPFSLFTVGVDRRGSATGAYRGTMGIGVDGNYPALDFQLDGISPNGWNPWMSASSPLEWNGGSARVAPYDLDNSQGNVAALTSNNIVSGANNIISYVNGYKETTTLDADRNVQIGNGVFIGSSGDAQYIGLIPEAIAYKQQLSDADVQKVSTYLAIKYGITLGQSNTTTAGLNAQNYNYVATDGTVIWNTATNSGYNFDLAGIGQDNFEGLNQKQSRSVNGGFQPALGLGTVEATNEANTGTFAADKSYMVWGSNGSSSNYALSYTPHSFTISAPVYLMNRVWKVQETQTVGVVTVSVPGSSTGVYLLVANSPTSLTNGGATEYALVSDGNGNLTAQVDLANGQYFTFGKALYAPGCVSANLLTWYKADVGVTGTANVTSWADQHSGYHVTQTTTADQPSLAAASATFNFNPSLNFTGTNHLEYKLSRFISTTSSGTMFGVASNNTDGGYENLADLGIDNPHMGTLGAEQIMWMNGSAPVRIDHPTLLTSGKSTILGYFWNGGGPNVGSGLRQNGTEFYDATTEATLVGNSGTVDGMWTIGGYENVENWHGNIAEIVLYDRNLTSAEKDRVDTYLAVKYGTTLSHNYLSGGGTTIYNVSSYSANVTGIGRDDCQQLLQKQSKSINSNAKLTIGLAGTIAATNAENPGSFTSSSAFLVIGDNGLTGLTSFSSVTAACPIPPSTTHYTNLNYKATETGNVPATFVQFDASGNGFNPNFPLFMQVATDAAFTNLISSAPMSFSGGIATTNYDFPANSTVYIRFAGNTTFLANICEAPKPQTFHWNGWWYGTKTKTIVPNYGLNNTLANPVMSVSITDGTTDPNVLLYKPSVNWWPVFDGRNIFIPRYDNNTAAQENSVVTTKLKFFAQSSLGVASTSAVAAQTVDFVLRDIDGYVRGKDIVKVYGKIGAATVFPKITRTNLYPGLASTALTISGNTITAGNLPWDLTVLGNAYVSFESPVEEVYVEYTKDNTYNFRVYNDIRIGAVTVTCKPPVPRAPLADNVYVYKQATPGVQKIDEVVDYKFTIQNTDCANKVIDFTDNLPGGLIWVDSTVVTPLAYTSLNNYGNTANLSITGMTVPPGTSYLYVSVRGSAVGEYLNQASYVVTNGTGATNLSDDPSVAGTGMQPTPLTLIDNDPEAQLSVAKAVNHSTTAQNTIVTYSFTVTSDNSLSAVPTTFQDVLPGELTFVAGSLSGLSGGYTSSTAVSAYAGESTLTLRDLPVPAGGSVTFSIQANVNSYTVGAVASNGAMVTPDVNSGFRIRTINSNIVSTTIIEPPTVSIISPANSTTTALNPTVSGTATPGAQVVLTSSTGGTLCTTTATAGGTWSCPVTLTAGPQTLSAVASNAAGVSSPATTQITATNTVAPLTASNPPAKTAAPGATQTGDAASELLPSGGTAPYTYSNDTGNASCTAVAGATQLPPANLTVVSGTGAYSYAAPSTPGVYYFCIKVCDSSTPTPECVTKTYTLTVTAASAAGTLDCSTAQIMGLVAGTAGNGVLKLSIAVTTAGTLPVTVSGSGLSANPSPFSINATATGAQTFYVPLAYSGAAFAAGTTITVTGAGTCTVDMTAVTPKTVSTSVLNLGPACTPATAATLIK